MIDFKKYYDISEFKDADFTYIYDKKYNQIIQYIQEIDEDDQQKILDKLNNKTDKKFEHKFEIIDNGYIAYNSQKLFLARGWGYLTGTSGCNLNPEDAIKVQEQILKYIINKLNE